MCRFFLRRYIIDRYEHVIVQIDTVLVYFYCRVGVVAWFDTTRNALAYNMHTVTFDFHVMSMTFRAQPANRSRRADRQVARLNSRSSLSLWLGVDIGDTRM